MFLLRHVFIAFFGSKSINPLSGGDLQVFEKRAGLKQAISRIVYNLFIP